MKTHTLAQEHLADARERAQGILTGVAAGESWDTIDSTLRAITRAVAATERTLACERLAALEQQFHCTGSLSEPERRDLVTSIQILKPWEQEQALSRRGATGEGEKTV